MSVEQVTKALAAKTGFEAVQVSGNDTGIRLLGRVPQARMFDLLAVFNNIADRAPAESWVVDTSKLYFRPEGGTGIVFAWRLIFETKDPAVPLPTERVAAIILQTAHVSRAEGQGPLQEIKLVGSSPLRNAPNSMGKGAALMGQAVVGPMRRR